MTSSNSIANVMKHVPESGEQRRNAVAYGTDPIECVHTSNATGDKYCSVAMCAKAKMPCNCVRVCVVCVRILAHMHV